MNYRTKKLLVYSIATLTFIIGILILTCSVIYENDWRPGVKFLSLWIFVVPISSYLILRK